MKVEQKRLDKYLHSIHGSTCPLCGSNNWTISDQVFQAIEFDYKGLLINGASYPMVPLTCRNCGNTYFINALVSGLIDKPSDAKSSTKTSSEQQK